MILAGYCLLLRDRRSLVAAAFAGVGWLVAAAWRGYDVVHEVVPGLNHIALSLAFFAVAVVVSLGKAGMLSRWLDAWSVTAPHSARLRVAVKHFLQSRDRGRADGISAEP
jgi:hypothetical protein